MSAPSAINNARQIIIGGTPGTGITTTTLKNATFIANAGEVGIFTPEGLRILETGSSPAAGVSVAATSEMDFVLAISRGASKSPIVSDVIKGSSITVANKGVYAAATEQSLAVGYNGTSGLIADVATYAGELYKVSILVHQFMSGTDSEHLKAGYYQSALTDGQSDIALGIAGSVIKNFSREVSNSDGDKPVKAKAVCSNAGVAVTGAPTNYTISKGSDQLGYTGTDPSNISVGDFLKLDESVGGATASTDPVFKVLAVDTTANVITLDRAYQGTAMSAAAVANIRVITAALGAAADWGVILDGTALPFNKDKKRYAKCRFDVVLDTAFGSTAVSTLASANEGEGTFEAVSQLENFLARMMSESYEMGAPFTFNITDDLLATSAVAGGGYDLITLKFSDSRVVSFQNEVSPKELILAIPFTTPAYAGSGTDDITDVLEDIIPANALIPTDLAL